MEDKIAESPRRQTRAKLMQKLRNRNIEFPPSATLAQLQLLLDQSEELDRPDLAAGDPGAAIGGAEPQPTEYDARIEDVLEHTDESGPSGSKTIVGAVSAPITATVSSATQPLMIAVTEPAVSRPFNPHTGTIPRTTVHPSTATVDGQPLNPSVGEFIMPGGSGRAQQSTVSTVAHPLPMADHVHPPVMHYPLCPGAAYTISSDANVFTDTALYTNADDADRRAARKSSHAR